MSSGRSKPTVPELAELLEESPPIDRTTLNVWEDADFLTAARATGRGKLVLCALWTEMCMAFPALDAQGGLRRLPGRRRHRRIVRRGPSGRPRAGD